MVKKTTTKSFYKYNKFSQKLDIESEIVCEKECNYLLNDIIPILVNEQIDIPEDIYSEYRDIYHVDSRELFIDNKLRHNIILIPPNMVGIEYVKSHIYTSPFKATNLKAKNKTVATVIEVLDGSALVSMQLRKPIEACANPDGTEPELYEIVIAKLKKGEKLPIFPGYDFCIHNLKSSSLVISKIYSQDFKLGYHRNENLHGMGYYVIRKNGKSEIVPNSHYKNLPKARLLKHKELMSKYDLSQSRKLYDQVCDDPIRFHRMIESFEQE